MNSFFHGWRQKVGLFTLMSAAVITLVWIRSLLIWDTVAWKDDRANYVIRSFNGRIGSQRIAPSSLNPLTGWFSDKAYTENLFDPWYGDEGFGDIKWRLQVLGFNCRSAMTITAVNIDGIDCRSHQLEMVFPYWSITTPLVLASGYLLVFPMRTIKPTIGKRR